MRMHLPAGTQMRILGLDWPVLVAEDSVYDSEWPQAEILVRLGTPDWYAEPEPFREPTPTPLRAELLGVDTHVEREPVSCANARDLCDNYTIERGEHPLCGDCRALDAEDAEGDRS